MGGLFLKDPCEPFDICLLCTEMKRRQDGYGQINSDFNRQEDLGKMEIRYVCMCIQLKHTCASSLPLMHLLVKSMLYCVCSITVDRKMLLFAINGSVYLY